MSPQQDAVELTVGLEGEATTTVTDALTAPAVGSGTVAVYATPCLAALMEEAAVKCVEALLPVGQASLGVHIDIKHTAATPPGVAVTAIAKLVAIDGRKLTFDIAARDSVEPIGTASHTRVVVDAERFLGKVLLKSP